MSSNKDSSSSNPNNSSSPNNRSPRRGGETRTPPRPRPITPREGALTPPPRLSPLQSPPPNFGSHRSAFTHFPQGTAGGIPVGGSGVSGVVGLSESPVGSKRGRPEKEAVVGEGEGTEDKRKKCSICGKVFASEKAVFGHMRLHRDRGWRGAHPPPTFNAEEEFSDVPGINLPSAVQVSAEGVEEDGAVQVSAEGVEEGGAATEAERQAEEAAVAAVERRRGIRIDLNVDVTKEGPDDVPKA